MITDKLTVLVGKKADGVQWHAIDRKGWWTLPALVRLAKRCGFVGSVQVTFHRLDYSGKGRHYVHGRDAVDVPK